MRNLLLLHGALGSKEQLDPLAELLKDQYTVHTLNFSGHGGEPSRVEGFSIPAFVKEVLDYLDNNKIDQVNIFGYSMGGYVAMFLARHYPARVGKLVTLSTKFSWDKAIAEKEIKMLDPRTILEKIPRFARQLEHRHFPNDWKDVLEKTSEMMLSLGRKNELELEDYAEIAAPGMLLLGELDKMITREETISVAQRLKAGIFQLLENTDHPLERTDLNLLAGLIKKHIG